MTELDDELQERLRAHQEACGAGLATERRIEDAVELVALAEDERYRDCQVRICLYDKLIQAYQAFDDVGYAEEVASVSASLERETTPGHSCFYCMRTARIESSRHLGRTDEAASLWRDATLITPESSLIDLYYVPILDSQRMWVALDTGDVEASRTCVARIAERLRRLEDYRGSSGMMARVHQNTREMLHEMTVIHHLVAGDVAAAVAEYDRSVAHDEQSSGRVNVQIALAEALLDIDNPRADSLFSDALAYVEETDHPRERCIIYLAQARRARTRQDYDAAVAAAAEQLPRLKSRDLHAAFDRLASERAWESASEGENQ